MKRGKEITLRSVSILLPGEREDKEGKQRCDAIIRRISKGKDIKEQKGGVGCTAQWLWCGRKGYRLITLPRGITFPLQATVCGFKKRHNCHIHILPRLKTKKSNGVLIKDGF